MKRKMFVLSAVVLILLALTPCAWSAGVLNMPPNPVGVTHGPWLDGVPAARGRDSASSQVCGAEPISDPFTKTLVGNLEMNGFEVIRQLRDRLAPARWRINQAAKIIVVTGRGEQETADFTRKLGADAYLVKPVDPNQLLSTVRNVLSG